ncbi:MAG: hypothetical protein IIZ75_06755 [Lachnospiraceae bacterium]|nr:hypothetical protein [Lachnospiraceae bacterium]
MGDPVKELQQEKNNNINPINTDPLQTSQNNINAPVNLNTQAGHIDQQIHMDQTNEVNQINVAPIHLRNTETTSKLSTLRLFRDAVVIEDRREQIGQLNLPKFPKLGDIRKAWENTEFVLTDSVKERTKILEDSKRKRFMSIKARNIQKEDNGLRTVLTLSSKDVVKLTDEKFLTRYTGMDHNSDYIKARFDLIKNRYYALVPEKEIKKLPTSDILNRLRKLYSVKGAERDTDLIDYYQNILIIRNCEKEISQEKGKDGEKIEEDNKQKAGITAEKEWGIRTVIDWMRRNCDKSSVSKSAFVDRIEKASAAKQLLICYLVEKGLHAAPSDQYCYSALSDYVPDVSKIKGQVVASNWNFWKRIGSDSSDRVIDWSRLGMAARFALNCDIADTILNNEKMVTEVEGAENEDPVVETIEEKKNRLMSVLEKKGELILTLYRSVGLSPEMPADIIEDKSLRERLLSLITSFNESQEELKRLDEGVNDDLESELQGKVGNISKGVMQGGETSKGIMESMEKHSKTLSNTVSQIANTDKMLSYEFDNLKTEETGNMGVAITSGITGVLATLQLIASFKTAAGIAQTASRLTTADHTSKALAVSGNILKNAGDISTSSTTLAQYFQGVSVYAPQTSWVGETTVKSLGEHFATVSGGVKFCAGCASILAGSLNMASAGIEIGRSVSSRHDIKNAREKLDKISDQEKTEDHKKLKLFLDHEKRVLKNNDISAGVRATTGFLTFAGGVLMATGILAPIGGILSMVGSMANLGYSLFYARHRRNLARKQAVDDALKLDEALELVRAKDEKRKKPKYAEFSDDVLKKVLRQDALAELGYATYKECFIDLCKQNAVMLYQHVFEQKQGEGDQKMYEDALSSLGLKIKYPTKPAEKPIPGVPAILAKLMA